MLTETQRNFQKQMKELEKESKSKSQDSVYSYIERDFVSNRVKITKKRVIGFSSIIGFIIIGFYLFSYISSAFNQVTAYNQKPVVSYVQKIIIYDNQINQIIQSTNTSIKNLKMKSSDSKKQFVSEMNNNLNSVQSIVNEVTAISTPKELENYKNAGLVQYKDIYSGINFYIIGVKSNNQDNLNNAHSMFSKNVADSILKRNELIKVFDKYKIKYEIQQDDTLRFWYKTNKVY